MPEYCSYRLSVFALIYYYFCSFIIIILKRITSIICASRYVYIVNYNF